MRRRIQHKIYATGQGAEPCSDPRHSANPVPYRTRRLQGDHTPGPAPIFDQRRARAQRTLARDTHVIGQRVQVGLR